MAGGMDGDREMTPKMSEQLYSKLYFQVQQASSDEAVSLYKAVYRYKAVKIAWRNWGSALITCTVLLRIRRLPPTRRSYCSGTRRDWEIALTTRIE